MPSKVLIPVDFNVESLVTLKVVLEQTSTTGLGVVLMYARHTDDSITDLLFYSPSRIIKLEAPTEFMDALAIIRNRYESTLDNVSIRLFHGQTVAAFRAFAEANRIAEIVLPKTYGFKPADNGFDPIPLIRKSGLPQREVSWAAANTTVQMQQLFPLFTQTQYKHT